ncbi:MAG: tRNA-intron lyase [Nanoarchaeota archaeon]
MGEEKQPVNVFFSKERILTENTDPARELFNQSRYGSLMKNGGVQLSLIETLYLLEKNRIRVLDGRNQGIEFENLLKKARRIEPNVWTRYCVFRDMRDRGYIIKTALKFGADFRVYDRGVKPGEDHARWVVYPVSETSNLTWYEFAAKNRVAHSTKKRLLIGIVDEENSVTYYEIKWTRP